MSHDRDEIHLGLYSVKISDDRAYIAEHRDNHGTIKEQITMSPTLLFKFARMITALEEARSGHER